jgi:hypothetical protein
VPEHNRFFETAIGLHQDSGAVHDYPNPFEHFRGTANDVDQYHNLDFERTHSHSQLSALPTSPLAAPSDHELLRGITNYVGQSNSGSHVGGDQVKYPSPTPFSYTASQHSALPAGVSPASMQSSPQFSTEYAAAPDDATPERQTKYAPFQHRFRTSDKARDHRRRGTRFEREPYCNPNTDATIADIENNRHTHVNRIYNAMTSGEAAKDNRGSIAMKRWVLDAHYPPELVEAYAHKVLDCLLLQVKEGFRGWVHNDYVADERKGDDIDKDVDCAGRLDNIVLALEQEKTICEDVMNSACQIRMFVNAPRAYANRKHQNRVGNSKRGRTKDTPDSNPKASNITRTGSKRARARSSTSRDTPPQTLQPHRTKPAPYRVSPASQQPSPSPILSGYASVAPRMITPLHRPTMSAHRNSFGQHSMPAMSPPTLLSRPLHATQSHVPRMANEPPQLHSPFMSPLPPTPYEHFAPASLNDVKPIVNDSEYDAGYGVPEPPIWMQERPAIDSVLSQWALQPGEEHANPLLNHHESGEFVNLSDIEGGRCYMGCLSSSADICRRDHVLQS